VFVVVAFIRDFDNQADNGGALPDLKKETAECEIIRCLMINSRNMSVEKTGVLPDTMKFRNKLMK